MERDVYQEWFELENDHWWFVGRRTLFMGLIQQAVRATCTTRGSGPLIVDIGCGTGMNLEALARFGRVIGVDVSETALEFCRRRETRTLCRARMDALPFASGSVQLLTAFDVLEHGPDDRAMLAEAFRVSAPGGWAVFSVPAYPFMWGDHDVAAHHYRRYTLSDLRRKVQASGFYIHRTTFLNAFLFPVSVIFRQGKNLLSRTLRLLRREIEFRTDFRSTEPALLNPLLLRVFTAEALLLKHGDLPFGLSLCCIARKPAAPDRNHERTTL